MVRAVRGRGESPFSRTSDQTAEKQPSYIGGFRVDKAAGYVGGKGFVRREGTIGEGQGRKIHSCVSVMLRVLYTELTKLGERRKRNKRFDLTRCAKQRWELRTRKRSSLRNKEKYIR